MVCHIDLFFDCQSLQIAIQTYTAVTFSKSQNIFSEQFVVLLTRYLFKVYLIFETHVT